MSTGWSNIKYKQDLPPAGGYKPLPYKRNLVPLRLSGLSLFGVACGISYFGLRLAKERLNVLQLNKIEDDQAYSSLEALLEAENDRRWMRWTKEKVESEALNIVGAGYDLDYKPGNHEVFHNKSRWADPYPICDEFKFTTGDSKLNDSIRYFYTRFADIVLGP